MSNITDDYFQQFKPQGVLCDTPEDIAIREKINREMEVVKREASNRFNQSINLSRGLKLRDRTYGN